MRRGYSFWGRSVPPSSDGHGRSFEPCLELGLLSADFPETAGGSCPVVINFNGPDSYHCAWLIDHVILFDSSSPPSEQGIINPI